MSLSPEINLALHRRQGDAFLSEATEILYGGAAGGGKSHLMRAAAIAWCAEVPGLQVYLFRRISEDLVKNHVDGPKGLRMLLAPWVGAGLVSIVEDEIRFWNGSKIYLCHCKDEKDRFKYLGAEIHVLLIDELTTFTDVIYRFLRGRVRAVGLNLPEKYVGRFPRILTSSNPGNLGHHWVKAAFIDNAQPMELRQMPDEEGGMVRQFIPAKLADNPSMALDDPNYRQRLRGLGSPQLVKAMEEGDWDVVEGAYFPEFSRLLHVLAPFEIPKHWARIRAFDWGSARPFCCLWIAVSDGEIQSIPRGALVVYREWYGARGPNVGIKLDVEAVAVGIRDRSGSEDYSKSVADPACFAQDGGPSLAERMLRAGKLYFYPADNKRIPGWDQVRSRLVGEDGRPMLYVFSTCTNLIRTLPALQHDQFKPEDTDTDGEDHAPDALRYGCMSRPWVKDAPAQPRPPKLPQEYTMNDWIAAAERRDSRRATTRF